MSTSSPTAASREEDDDHRELKESHRTTALKWSRNRHPSKERDEANGDRPSTRDTPQLLQPPDLNSPSTATAAEGGKSQIRRDSNHNTHELNRIQAKVGQQQPHLVKTKMRWLRTPT
jgi:hypothetical protein